MDIPFCMLNPTLDLQPSLVLPNLPTIHYQTHFSLDQLECALGSAVTNLKYCLILLRFLWSCETLLGECNCKVAKLCSSCSRGSSPSFQEFCSFHLSLGCVSWFFSEFILFCNSTFWLIRTYIPILKCFLFLPAFYLFSLCLPFILVCMVNANSTTCHQKGNFSINHVVISKIVNFTTYRWPWKYCSPPLSYIHPKAWILFQLI